MNVGLPTPGGVDAGPARQPGQPLLSVGYADGGAVQAAQRAWIGNNPNPAILERRIASALRDPAIRQALMARPQQMLASGELTIDEVQMISRVAEAALYNPALYPQLRQFVVEQGMTPLPAAYDQTVVLRIVAIARALQSQLPPGQVPSVDQASMMAPQDGMGGGYLQGPGTGRSDSIGTINETNGEPVSVSNGEYVIPAHVVRAKGREFFDNLLRRYANEPKGEA